MLALNSIDWAYCLEIIIFWMLVYFSLKLIFTIFPIVNDPIPWLLEGHLIEAEEHWHRDGYVEYLVRNQPTYFLTEIWGLLISIASFTQVILFLTLVEMNGWKAVMEQIVKFHEQNVDISLPNIPSDILDTPYSYTSYLYFFGVSYLGVLLALFVDRAFMQPEEVDPDVFGEMVMYSGIGLAAFVTLVFFGSNCDRCTAGELELLSLVSPRTHGEENLTYLIKVHLVEVLKSARNLMYEYVNATIIF